ncbi:asparagine synthase (glutamine-hydrolyzing) [Streptosporangium fragile]|uniref:asparagine synthase (glutamine-hydrolyzing) n=1 Tax=Streptosporangium fragile TaxID=46186 RepID=A0ABP6IR38_9ACTN
MCGITGWVAFEADLTRERPVIDAMTETMACRGPDDGGVWLARRAAIGHRRLAVIDVEGGRQPMTARTGVGEVVLTYSGEAYNFTELREELRRAGHVFSTRSDTEVVLRAYLEWGHEMVHRLNGMYAFAVWDGRVERLLLVRDRLGVKPLYYARTDDGVVFGSEPKALLANPLVRREVGADGLREIFAVVRTPGAAVWSGMREVRPGHTVLVDRDGPVERAYWRLEAAEHRDGREATVATVRELLADAVRRQLTSDVPRCSLLSGGLDSSVVTAMAAAELRGLERVRTFEVDFLGQEDNFVPDNMRGTADSPFAREVASHVGTDHHHIVLDPGDLLDPEVRRAAVVARDVPVGWGELDSSLYLLFRGVREKSTVALSGESADEVFGGYGWFHDPAIVATPVFPWLIVTGDHALGSMLHPDIEAKLRVEEFRADSYADAVAEVPVLPGESGEELRMRRMLHICLTRWLQVMLDRKDRMSMAVGLEVRVPFCDHRLVEYVFNTPWALKSFDGREKSLLRAASAGLLPESVLRRRKSPYPSTQDPAYSAGVQAWARRVLDDPSSPVRDLVGIDTLRPLLDARPAELPWGPRVALERVIDLDIWFDVYRPSITL